MNEFAYTDSSMRAVTRTLPSGVQESFLVGAPEVQDYLAAGSIIASLVSLEDLRSEKKAALVSTINDFIERKPDGYVRYDTNLKLNLLQASVNAMAAGQDKPALVAAVESWIATVTAEYFALKSAIQAAPDEPSLASIDISYETLESKFGVAGSVQADPDVSTEQLLS